MFIFHIDATVVACCKNEREPDVLIKANSSERLHQRNPDAHAESGEMSHTDAREKSHLTAADRQERRLFPDLCLLQPADHLLTRDNLAIPEETAITYQYCPEKADKWTDPGRLGS